jgi:hypothetical protein
MTTFTDTYGFNRGSASRGFNGGNPFSKVEIVLDMPKIVAARLAASATALAFTDVLQVLPVKAGTLVMDVTAHCLVAGTAASTIGVGDGGSTSRFLTTFNTASATTSVSAVMAAPYHYAAADTIDVIFNTATDILGVHTLTFLLYDTSEAYVDS